MDFIILYVCKLEDLARLKLQLQARIFIPHGGGMISCSSAGMVGRRVWWYGGDGGMAVVGRNLVDHVVIM